MARRRDLCVAAAALAWTHFREQPSDTAAREVRNPAQACRRAEVSPPSLLMGDGSPTTIWAPMARPSLFVRDLGSMESHAVPGSGEMTNVGAPVWSTDSRELAFNGAGGLMAVAPEGGTPRKVTRRYLCAFSAPGTRTASCFGNVGRHLAGFALRTQMTVLLRCKTRRRRHSVYPSPHSFPMGATTSSAEASPNPERAGIFVASLDAAEAPKRLTDGSDRHSCA